MNNSLLNLHFKLRGEEVSDKEMEFFIETTKKYGDKLNNTKTDNILHEIIKENEGNLENRFSLTSEDQINLEELKLLKKKGKLKGLLSRNKLKNLTKQVELDKLHKKYVKNGKLTTTDAKRYKELHNSPYILNKFDLEAIETTSKLEGKIKKFNIFKNIPRREKSKWDKNIEELRETEYLIFNKRKYINRTKESQNAIDELVKIQNLTGYDRELASIWSGDANIPMNEYLLGVKNIDLRKAFKLSEIKKYVEELIKLIENMPKDKCLKEDTLLFRGVRDERMDLSMFIADGKTRKLKTFTSSSYDVDTADGFAGYTDASNCDGWIIKIYAPKGTKGVAINGEIFSGEEYEYLLSPNQKFITKKVDKENKFIEIKLIN